MSTTSHYTWTLEKMNELSKGTLVENLGIVYTDSGPDFLTGIMPVNEKTRQPLGLLHGGASAAFAETLGSMASLSLIDPETHSIVGIEINATHVRKATSGFVTGKATLLSKARKLHVWDIKITKEEGQTVCISRLTVMVITKK